MPKRMQFGAQTQRREITSKFVEGFWKILWAVQRAAEEAIAPAITQSKSLSPNHIKIPAS
ncbi:MAG: hypothetical protein AAF889_08235 [Cyanobacteria bacterium P01_D01_bin.73]